MDVKDIVESEAMQSLVDDYRTMCFWSMDEGFYPRTRQEIMIALDNLERYGDMSAYRRAGEIRQWL